MISMDAQVIAMNNCTFSNEKDVIIFLVKLSMLCVSLVSNIIAIVLLCYYKCYRRFVFRLVLCLMVAHLLEVIVQILELIPVAQFKGPPHVRDDNWNGVCAAFGFFDEVTLWMSNFVMIWILLFLCFLMIRPRHEVHLFPSNVTIAEVMGFNFCFYAPFTFSWIPFVDNYFGLSGHWCWIKLTKGVCGDTDVTEGAAYMFVLYYAPLMLIVLLTFIISLTAVVILIKNIRKSDSITDAMIIVVAYPIVFIVVWCIISANRIESTRRVHLGMSPYFPLWMGHAIAEPTHSFLPALFFILQLTCPKTRKLVTDTRRQEYESIN